MKITPTERADAVVERVRERRAGRLSMTIGTGCCESTAAFLFEDHQGRADGVVVGAVDGVEIVAPRWIADSYGDDELVLDVDMDVVDDSMSVETDLGCRFVLVHPGQPRPAVCGPLVSDREAVTGPEASHPPRTPSLPPLDVPEGLRGMRPR